eukprot:403337867
MAPQLVEANQFFTQTQRIPQGSLVKLKTQQTEESMNSQYFAMNQVKFNDDQIFNEADQRSLKQNESPLMKVVRETNLQPNSKVMSSNNLDLFNGNLTIGQNTGTEPTLDITNSQKILQHQSFAEQQKNYGLLLPNSSQASTLPQTTDHRNVTLNSQQMTGQLPFRVKNMPKKSRSFGNPPGALMIGGTQQSTNSNTSNNIANITQNNFSIKQYQTTGVAQGDRQSIEKNLIQIGNQSNLIAKKLDIKQPIQAKEQMVSQLNTSQLRPNSLGKIQNKAVPDQFLKQEPLQRNTNNTPFSNKTTATTATSDYLKDENMQSPKTNVNQTTIPQKPSDNNLYTEQSPISKSSNNQESNQFSHNFLSHLSSINFKDKIMIHVIDDSKNQKKDFTFSRSLLVKYMKYFEKCLKKISENDEIDISIHCDAGIFEWLLNYIFNQEEMEKSQSSQVAQNSFTTTNGWQLRVQKCDDDNNKNSFSANVSSYKGPKLDQKNVVSILISADFLKIDRLVRHCMEYFVNNIEEISKIQVDMSCINSVIIREIAKNINLDTLDTLKERKDKLLLSCPKGKVFIDDHGQQRAKHVINKEWDLKKFITYVRETYRISWKEIYWKVWSYLHIFKCNKCQEFYSVAEMGNCKYHEKSVKVQHQYTAPGGSLYNYECCGKSYHIQQLLELEGRGLNGCKMQMHEPQINATMNTEKERKTLDRLVSHQLIILEYPSSVLIEDIQNTDSAQQSPMKGNSPLKQSSYKISFQQQNLGQSQTAQIIKPSSLNYKISLKQGVEEYIKKESKIEDIEIQVEELKLEDDAYDQDKIKQIIVEDFDDILYEMSIQVRNKTNPDTNQNITQAQTEWDKENEKMRRKLERNSINSLKYKYAQQQNNQGKSEDFDFQQQQQNQGQQDPSGSQRQSPTKLKPQGTGIQGNSNSVQQQQQPTVQLQPQLNQNAIQLNSEQLEEAKVMTLFKMRQFKRDRLQASDKDRINSLQDMLKKVRYSEQQVVQMQTEQQVYHNNQSKFAGAQLSPRQGSPSINQKQSGQNNNPFSISSNQQTSQQQVMTQITAICNKRSRSTNNQGGIINVNGQSPTKQDPIKNNETVDNIMNLAADRGKSPPFQQPRKNSGNNFEQPNGTNKSPRVNRLKNISPPSREKQAFQGSITVPQNQQADDKIVHSPTKLPNNIYQNPANATFYQHRKTNSSKLPQINSKTVETSSLSNTYYSKE